MMFEDKFQWLESLDDGRIEADLSAALATLEGDGDRIAWTGGLGTIDSKGRTVEPSHPDAVAWSVRGALIRALESEGRRTLRYYGVLLGCIGKPLGAEGGAAWADPIIRDYEQNADWPAIKKMFEAAIQAERDGCGYRPIALVISDWR